MATPLLTTKLYIPPARPNVVPRSRLIEQLSKGLRLGHKLTLISAPAGFGKTTLVSEWIHYKDAVAAPRYVAWWFVGLTITLKEDGNTLLTGPVVDQAFLFGIPKKVRDLGMPLLSVNCVEPGQADASDVKKQTEAR